MSENFPCNRHTGYGTGVHSVTRERRGVDRRRKSVYFGLKVAICDTVFVGKAFANAGILNYTHEFGADFALSVSKVEENLLKDQKTVWVSVKNGGTLMDTGKVEMFVDGKKVGDAIHYELGAGEEKLIPFKLAKENKQPVAFTTKYKMVSM